LLDVNLPSDVIHTQQQLMAAFAFTIAKFCASQPDATDPDVLTAMQALAETYKTLRSGIYYEKPPDAHLSRELYAALASFIVEVKQQQERSNSPALKTPTSSICWYFSTAWACSAPTAARAPPLHRVSPQPIPRRPRTKARRIHIIVP